MFVKRNELQAQDLTSLNQLKNLEREVEWLWVDALTPDEKEIEIILELMENEKTVISDIKDKSYNLLSLYTGYEKLHDYTLLSIPYAEIGEEPEMHPAYIVIKENLIFTWGCEHWHWPKLMQTVIRKVRNQVNENTKTSMIFILSRLFYEVSNRNSKSLAAFRELVDKVEEESLEKGGKKSVNSVFGLKRQLSTLHRLLCSQKELVSDAKAGIIPNVKPDEDAETVLEESFDSISSGLELIDSYDRGLDSVLYLLNLGSIHRVETSINYLTIMLVILTIILIALEILTRIAEGTHAEANALTLALGVLRGIF